MAREFQFYIVPTPIGNIQDITLRAIQVLKEVDIIACEDTRVTQKLLNHYEIKTKCISYHKYNEKEQAGALIELLKSGKKIALVSDAGTPLISDPGNVILKELIKNNIEYTALSGASAITTFMSSVPTDIQEFKFIGFIPRGENQIEEVVKQNTNTNLVFYESPQRIIKTLEIIKSVRNNVRVALGRELTKLFEEVFVDNISRTIEHFKNDIKGEIVCMLYADENADTQDIEYKITELKAKGFKDKEISIILSTLFDYKKNEIYKKCLKL